MKANLLRIRRRRRRRRIGDDNRKIVVNTIKRKRLIQEGMTDMK
jgi:hypothetical protein